MRIGRFIIQLQHKRTANTSPALTEQQVFLRELLDNHIKWSAINKEYGDAFLLLLHNFSPPKEEAEEAEVVK